MLPRYQHNGNLPAGIHEATWAEFVERFGRTAHRQQLLQGLAAGLAQLKAAGCTTVYVDGSFVTDVENVFNERPHDFDACWEVHGVNVDSLDAVFFTFEAARAAQKAQFGGEFFPADWPADPQGSPFVEYFQQDKNGRAKGIVKIALETLP